MKIAIIGRPNVGKSTLFNALIKNNTALIDEQAGMTRDRRYGDRVENNYCYQFIDTAGWTFNPNNHLEQAMNQQVITALTEADLILWVVDGSYTNHPIDHYLLKFIYKLKKDFLLVINKIDLNNFDDFNKSEFYRWSVKTEQLIFISALHRQNFQELFQKINNYNKNNNKLINSINKNNIINIAIIGRPNVGKSTLLNRLCQQERVIVNDQPGTTRDAIAVTVTARHKTYRFIDTAGLRKRTNILEVIEKKSTQQTIKTIRLVDVVLLIINATEGVTAQDLKLLKLINTTGQPGLILINQWDKISATQKSTVKTTFTYQLRAFQDWKVYFISAATGLGIGTIFLNINKVYKEIKNILPSINSALLTDHLHSWIAHHPPPLINGRRIKLRYAHFGGHHPLTIVLHGKQLDSLPKSYLRYLEKSYRESLSLTNRAIRFVLKTDNNPYD